MSSPLGITHIETHIHVSVRKRTLKALKAIDLYTYFGRFPLRDSRFKVRKRHATKVMTTTQNIITTESGRRIENVLPSCNKSKTEQLCKALK